MIKLQNKYHFYVNKAEIMQNHFKNAVSIFIMYMCVCMCVYIYIYIYMY
jgi:hypothetical protein